MTGDLDAILASIDGALADADLPDAMRWTPTPGTVDDAGDPYTEDRHSPLILTGRPQLMPGAPAYMQPVRELTLPEVMRLAVQAEQARNDYEQALANVRAVFAPAAEALARMVEAFGKIAADAGLRFSELVDMLGKAARDSWQPILPPRRLRDEDPRAYALALRQARSTGPDRQVQHRPRPRRI